MREISTSALALGLVLLNSGCATPERFRLARTSLDRAVRYTEVAGGSRPIELSGNGAQVPDGVGVDINSIIRIHIDTDALKLVDGYHPVDAAALYPGSRAQKLTDTLEMLGKLIESRKRAVSAYEKIRGLSDGDSAKAAASDEFEKAVSELGGFRDTFNMLPIWEDNTFSENVEPLFTKTYEKIGPLLQRELDAAQRALQVSVDEANKNSAKFQLQAFLLQSKADPMPIHLEHYDLFPQKEVAKKDGFVMDADDRKAFEAQYQQTVRIASQAEKVRTGEVSLNDAILASGSSGLRQLAKEAEDLKPLFANNWPATAKALPQDLKDLGVSVKKILAKHGQVEWDSIQKNEEILRTAVGRDLPLQQLQGFVRQIEDLRNDLTKVRPEGFLELFNRIQKLPGQAKALGAQFESSKLEQSKLALEEILATLQKRPPEITEDVWREVQAEISQSKFFQTAQGVRKQIQAAGQFMRTAKEILRFTEIAPVHTAIRPPEVLSVPLAEAKDTDLEIQRTPRLAEDRIWVAATLHSGQTETARSDAHFTVKYFGSHMALAPSVILARPFQVQAGSDNNFQFAPAVAWLYKYHPRNSESDFWSNLSRFWQPGLGMHVAFLNQGPQKNAQFGLGGAASFWQDRLVAGAGVNLMNNSRGYFYIGSNLIPILQGLQSMMAVHESGSGKRP